MLMCRRLSCGPQLPLTNLWFQTAPQPVRDASVTTTSRRDGRDPRTTPWDRNCRLPQGSSYPRHWLESRTGLPRCLSGSRPKVLTHTCKGRKARSPRGTSVDAAINMPNKRRSRP